MVVKAIGAFPSPSKVASFVFTSNDPISFLPDLEMNISGYGPVTKYVNLTLVIVLVKARTFNFS